MTVIGIDPGASGAIAVLQNGQVQTFDTPYAKVKGGKGEYSTAGMVRLLKPFEPVLPGDEAVHVVMELVHAMPGQGVTSMFNFGKGYGIWLGILSALGLPYTLVSPRTWKKVMLADMGAEKDHARIRAQQMFPAAAEQFTRKRDDGRAEAALLAEYGRRTLAVKA